MRRPVQFDKPIAIRQLKSEHSDRGEARRPFAITCRLGIVRFKFGGTHHQYEAIDAPRLVIEQITGEPYARWIEREVIAAAALRTPCLH